MSSSAQKSITVLDTEQRQVQAIDRMLNGRMPSLLGPSGEAVELPRPVAEVLRTAVGLMARGQSITLVPDNQLITTQRAADILGMSRPFFVGMLEAGVMAFHRVGNQRRVKLRDVLEFAERRDRERVAALGRLARDAFEAGLYERNVIPEGGLDE